VTRVAVICLGNPHAGDDGAALRAADWLAGASVIRAGRPGAGLLDLLDGDAPVVLADVTRSGSVPGTIHRYSICDLIDVAAAQPTWSSHGFGPGEALGLARALGRRLPPGEFVGIEGCSFAPGDELSPAVRDALPALVEAIRDAVERWE
jgi:hydrogenase maturation protease